MQNYCIQSQIITRTGKNKKHLHSVIDSNCYCQPEINYGDEKKKHLLSAMRWNYCCQPETTKIKSTHSL